MASILPFLKRTVSRDWSARELGEFYRVEGALVQAGMNVMSDRGVTDEGDPWFVFYRPEDDDVIVHFARIGRRYLISAPSYGADVTGYDFKALTLGLLERQGKDRLAQATGNIRWHPSALLTMLVASALIKSGHASAAEPRRSESVTNGADRLSPPSADSQEHRADDPAQAAQFDIAILIGVALAGASVDLQPFPTAVTASSGGLQTETTAVASPPDLDSNGPSGVVGSSTPVAHTPFPVADETFHSSNMASSQLTASQLNAGPDYLIGHATPLGNLVPVVNMNPAAEPAQLLDGLGARTDGTAASIHNEAQWLLSLLGGGEPIFNTGVLPAALAAPLHTGVHETTAQLHALSATATPLPAATPPLSSAADANNLSGGPNAVAAVHNTPVVSTALAESNISAVLTAMQQFAQQVGPHLAVLVTGNQVIEYDYYAVDHTPAAVSAVTYDFGDGSHISLVGLSAELPHALV